MFADFDQKLYVLSLSIISTNLTFLVFKKPKLTALMISHCMITFYISNIERKSGGIALAYRKCLAHFINPIESPLWFSISKQLTKTDDLLCGIIYIPPEGSDYSVKDPYREIENELYNYTDRYTHILLFGDMNSRSKDLPDYIHIDAYICSHFQSEELELDDHT